MFVYSFLSFQEYHMLTLLKILTFPLWFPIKVLWFVSKVLAFIFMVLILAALIYIAVHYL